MKTFPRAHVTLQKEGLCSSLVEEDEESIDKQEVEEKIHEEGYQTIEEEKKLPHDYVKDNEDLIEEQEPEEVNHEEGYQEEHELSL
jgi:hypothetical protein